jgi:SagB-type dehydrogenase family enzyme
MKILTTSAYLIVLLILASMPFTSNATFFPLEQTISRRQSIRSYTDENVTSQQLIEILNAAYGFRNGHRTIPQIGSDYSLTIFAVNSTASYRYIPETNTLTMHDASVNKETIRPYDDWVSDASVVILVVWNKTRMANQYFASAEAGCFVQNMYLAASSLDLGTCCVGSINSEGLRNTLNLTDDLIPLLVMPLGYPSTPYPDASPNFSLMTGNLPLVQYSNSSFENALDNMLFAPKWSSENLTIQELSQLLWAAYGYTNVTHDTSYHRTTPSAHGIYPLVIFVSNSSGVFQYSPENHSVLEILQGDKRLDIVNASSNQSWVASAPALFLIAYNSSYNGGNTGDGGALSHEFIGVDAGAVIQQLCLEASAWNLSAVLISQGFEEWNGTTAENLRSVLGMASSLVPLYMVPIGKRFVDTNPPEIGVPSQDPDPTAVEPNQNVTVSVDVVDEGVGVRDVILSYSINEGSTWTNTTMNNVSASTYVGKIPGFEAGTQVQYKIIAYDNYGNNIAQDNAGKYYVYMVLSEFTNFIILVIMATLVTFILTRKRKQENQSKGVIKTSKEKSVTFIASSETTRNRTVLMFSLG